MRGAIRVRRCRLRSTSGYTKLDGSAVLYFTIELLIRIICLPRVFALSCAPKRERDEKVVSGYRMVVRTLARKL